VRTRTTAVAALLAAVAALSVLATPPVASAQEALTFLLPGAHGVVDYGDRVGYELRGPCDGVTVRARAVVDGRTVLGPAARGCRGTAVVPSLAQVLATGYAEGGAAAVDLVLGGVPAGVAGEPLPLTLQRLEPDLGTVVMGSPEVVPATDPFGGVRALAMGAGDVVDLGPVDLDRIESAGVRHLAGTSQGAWELRVGEPTGRAIARGAFGPAGNIGSAGADGWLHSVAQLAWRGTTLVGDVNVLGNLTPAVGYAPHLCLAVVAAPEPVPVNWVDLNGSGAADLFAFPAERPGDFDVLFDGSSFDGWQHTGPGRFELRDGAMRADHEAYELGWAWLWYSREQFTDFNLRLRFKVESWIDNGGILLRHRDPRDDPNKVTGEAAEVQIQEEFENHTGGIAHEQDAERLATNLVGEWNQLEIVAVGGTYSVRMNGREVTRHETALPLRSGFISVENEQLVPGTGGHLWYDDIRIHRCTGPADPLCAIGR
jgi:hypothetical protein